MKPRSEVWSLYHYRSLQLRLILLAELLLLPLVCRLNGGKLFTVHRVSTAAERSRYFEVERSF